MLYWKFSGILPYFIKSCEVSITKSITHLSTMDHSNKAIILQRIAQRSFKHKIQMLDNTYR